MAKVSAGLLLYRRRGTATEVLLVHPGGPYWARKDLGAWSIPKGLVEPGEEPLAAARREFLEETGCRQPASEDPSKYLSLGTIKQRGGKTVHAWGVEGECDADSIVSNTMKMEWPPKSGRWITIPEVDKAGWFSLADARAKILEAQSGLLDRLAEALAGAS